MSDKNQIKISRDDLVSIYGDNYKTSEKKIIQNCYCVKCNSNYDSEIVNYEIFLNDLNDILLQGFCSVCGSRVNRYVETGEVEEYQEAIEKIKRKYSLN